METLRLTNGNRQEYEINLPKIIIWGQINDTALIWLEVQTGLRFSKKPLNRLEAQPIAGKQIAALFMTYNFKTKYYNNGTFKNELHLKFDHHVGYDVDSICFDCCKHNHIHTGDMTPESRLAC